MDRSSLLLAALFCEIASAQPSVHTVDLRRDSGRLVMEAQPGAQPRAAGHQSFQVASIRFRDDGRFAAPAELIAATDTIVQARQTPYAAGAIVLVFIHGWHHNADWDPASGKGDEHFAAFRQMLAFFATRESERSKPGMPLRRVVGVYLGWNGDPPPSWITLGGYANVLAFWNRYSTAQDIGGAADLRRAIAAIVQSTKDPLSPGGQPAPFESPLVMIGHSMGALILQSAFLALLKDTTDPLVRPPAARRELVRVQRDGRRIAFPDVLISLNSAADSVIHKEIRAQLAARKFTKEVGQPPVTYAGPLLISATSTGDKATSVVWRAANVARKDRKTDGYDESLFTHNFVADSQRPVCRPKPAEDFGQNWHCLRRPEPSGVATPRTAIDLPVRDRTGPQDMPDFVRYVLVPRGDMQRARSTWVFQLPPQIVSDHNDIYNPRATSLLIALIQLSGAIMSLAPDWPGTFE